VKSCESDGKPGWKWGDTGKCYTYTKGDKEGSATAKVKAGKQGRAVKAQESKHGTV